LKLTVGEPIDTHGITPRQVEELTARLRSAIEAMLAAEAQSEENVPAPIA
jgi:predicted RNase H-like HicB family nuclease